MAHLLNNDLALTICCLELVLEHPALPTALRVLARNGLGDTSRRAEHVRQFGQVVRVATKETPMGAALDLARSLADGEPCDGSAS